MGGIVRLDMDAFRNATDIACQFIVCTAVLDALTIKTVQIVVIAIHAFVFTRCCTAIFIGSWVDA